MENQYLRMGRKGRSREKKDSEKPEMGGKEGRRIQQCQGGQGWGDRRRESRQCHQVLGRYKINTGPKAGQRKTGLEEHSPGSRWAQARTLDGNKAAIHTR